MSENHNSALLHITIIPLLHSIYLPYIWIKNYSRYLVQIIHSDRGHWKEMHCSVLLFHSNRLHPPPPEPNDVSVTLIMLGASYPCHQGANQFTGTAVPRIHTEFPHICFANLFSIGICLCTYHLAPSCHFYVKSIDRRDGGGGRAMSLYLVFIGFLL